VKVVYNSFNGRYSDTPRAVHEAVLQRDRPPEHEHMWLADPQHDGAFPVGTVTVPI
jgi:CDP-glycerol glycerophosphotransferase